MDESVKKYKERRDARVKKRLDDDWITINGAHVMVDDDKNITKGPRALKALPNKNRAIKAEDLLEEETTPRNRARVVSGRNRRIGTAPDEKIAGGEKEYQKEFSRMVNESSEKDLNDKVSAAFRRKGEKASGRIKSTVQKALRDMPDGMRVKIGGAEYERVNEESNPGPFKDSNGGYRSFDVLMNKIDPSGEAPTFRSPKK